MSSAGALSLHCGDCQGSAALTSDPDSPDLLDEVRGFLADHDECVFTVAMVVPRQRGDVERTG